jgi:hypothetical protein
MTTNVELYEALKPYVGQEAAGMIADVVPPAKDIATKTDMMRVEGRIDTLEAKIDAVEARLEAKISDVEARLAHKLLTYSIPIWGIVGSMALAIVGLVATRL